MAAMHFHLLGPLEVHGDGTLVELGRPKQRAVLAVLLVSANRVVPLDRLVELLWDGEAPTSAVGALQAYVSNLRRALEPDRPARAPAEILVTQAPGYVLRVEPGHLDSARFECSANRGHDLLMAGRPATARTALEEGLSLWRGPALAEYASERFAQAEAARLEARRAAAIEDRLQADLDLGAHGQAVAELESIVREDPLRERAWALLMLAHYRAGQQADALRAYTRARTILAEELGVEPSPALRALEAEVLAQSPTLDWHAPAREHTAPLSLVSPPMSRPVTPAGRTLVGRQRQLEVLSEALADAAGGNGRLVLLSGEAGIGKTRLAEEITARALDRGAIVAWGRAYEADGAPPFWPWIQVARALSTSAEPGTRARAEELARLVPELHDRLGPAPAGPALAGAAARFRLYEAVSELVLEAARHRPIVVVVLDDLHWADPLSVGLLAHLARRIQLASVLVLATDRRPDGHESEPADQVLGELARLDVATRLTVPGLTPDEVAHLMRQAAGFDPTPDQVAAVHARTEGNPFFVAELSRILADEGDASSNAVPTGVRDVVRARLAGLPEGTRALLIAGSVAGREFNLAVAAAAADVPLDDAIGLVEGAVAGGIVTEDETAPGHYRFSHALVRDTVYAGIPGLRRAGLHARVGEAVEALPDADARTAELANHFYRAATVAGPDKGLEYALAASERARASLAYEQAMEHLGRALDLVAMLPPGRHRNRSQLRVQNRLAVLLTVADGFTAPRAIGGWDRAGLLSEAVDDEDQQLASDWGQVSLSCVRADLESTGRLGRELLQRGSRSDHVASLMTGHFTLGRAALFCGDLAEALARFRETRALCDALDERTRLDVFGWLDPAVLSRVNAGFVLALAGEHAQARRWVAEGGEVAGVAAHPLSLGAALMFDTVVAVVGGDVARADAGSRSLHDLASHHGLPDFVAQAAVFGGWASSHGCTPDGAVARITEGMAAKRSAGFLMWQTIDYALLADAARRCGAHTAALDAVDAGIAAAGSTGERFYLAELHRMRGELLAERGPCEREEAAASLTQALLVAIRQGAGTFRSRAQAALDGLAAEDAPVPG